MIRVNYVAQSTPALLESLRRVRVPETLRRPGALFVTVLAIIAAWSFIETQALQAARDDVARASLRLAETRSSAEVTRDERRSLERLLALDRDLHRIVLSGASLSAELARLGGQVPLHAWLTSIDRGDASFAVTGRSKDVATIADFILRTGSGSGDGPRLRVRRGTLDTAYAFDLQVAAGDR